MLQIIQTFCIHGGRSRRAVQCWCFAARRVKLSGNRSRGAHPALQVIARQTQGSKVFFLDKEIFRTLRFSVQSS